MPCSLDAQFLHASGIRFRGFFADDFRSRQSVRPAISMAGWSEAEKKDLRPQNNGCFF